MSCSEERVKTSLYTYALLCVSQPLKSRRVYDLGLPIGVGYTVAVSARRKREPVAEHSRRSALGETYLSWDAVYCWTFYSSGIPSYSP